MGGTRNRDIGILGEVVAAMQEVCRYEDMSEWSAGRMFNITRQLTGMPRGSKGAGGLDSAFASLEHAQERYARELEECISLLNRAEEILNGIENREMRNFVILMYVLKKPKADICRELNMSEWGFRQARKAVEQAIRMQDVKWNMK